MTRSILFFLIALATFSCGNNDSTNETEESYDTITPSTTRGIPVPKDANDTSVLPVGRKDDGKVPPQNDTGKVRLMVSFISKGFGIDYDSKAKFDRWLAQKPTIQYYVSPWGREGEMSYCFHLSNLSTDEQKTFATDVRNLLTNRNLVYINEWVDCEKRR